jgi:NAD(P)-dependent dehydrogenase (short-subunit alcohol dehydrogenase family)
MEVYIMPGHASFSMLVGTYTRFKEKVCLGQTPLGRPGQPAELGSIYVQLAASDASYATGQIYGSSGGSGQP